MKHLRYAVDVEQGTGSGHWFTVAGFLLLADAKAYQAGLHANSTRIVDTESQGA